MRLEPWAHPLPPKPVSPPRDGQPISLQRARPPAGGKTKRHLSGTKSDRMTLFPDFFASRFFPKTAEIEMQEAEKCGIRAEGDSREPAILTFNSLSGHFPAHQKPIFSQAGNKNSSSKRFDFPKRTKRREQNSEKKAQDPHARSCLPTPRHILPASET